MINKGILLVEDNPQDELLILRVLRKAMVASRIDVVRDGQQALDSLFHEGEFARPDDRDLPVVVLLDVHLPKISGLEVLRHLRADKRTGLASVVILTSSDEERDRMQSYEHGANSFVRKPLDFPNSPKPWPDWGSTDALSTNRHGATDEPFAYIAD